MSELDQTWKPLVAVVDDDTRVLESLDDLLQVSGYRTALYATAEHFLEARPRAKVALLISDIALPGMSGIDLLRTLHGDSTYPPTILITGRSETYIEREAHDLGALRLFLKPFDMVDLLTTLRASLSMKDVNP
jgi:two-component system, LuxR family, response regulator FixJ